MLDKKTIVLDAGHGGKDTGAYNGDLKIKEKTINLAVALYSRRYITKHEVPLFPVLTRKRDKFPTLQQRCDISNEANADAFISIHCNSREVVGRHGIEVEIFHFPGSSGGLKLAEPIFESYIRTLEYLVFEDDQNLKVFNRGIKEEYYYVLKHTNAPAVLLELAFLCDSEEAVFLNKAHHQRAIARSIVDGILNYFEI